MSKTIKRFREEPYGLFVDLIDADAAIAVNPKTGEILLDEGIGEGRFHGAVISAGSFIEFALEPESENSARLVLRFGRGKSHVLGSTSVLEEATKWVLNATQVITSKQGMSPTRPQGKDSNRRNLAS